MKAWIVTVGEPLPIDAGSPRLFRSGQLATGLARAGHEVVWWTSTFDHYAKRHRFDRSVTVEVEPHLTVRLLHGCGYRRNVSLRRILDHVQVARDFERLARNEAAPDVILASLPTLELAVKATAYGKARGVPVLVDVRDLWPDLFMELAPRPLRPVFRHLLGFMERQAVRACREATGITGNSPGMVSWGVRKAGRTPTEADRHFPFGYDDEPITQAEREEGYRFWKDHGVAREDGAFVCCFFGTIGAHFELDAFIVAARRLEESGKRVKMVFCGAGGRLDELRQTTAPLRSVLFPGWVDKVGIRTLMELSDVGLAPFKNHVGFVENLTNKPIEYMCGGLPVVSTLDGYLGRLLRERECGIVVPPDPDAIARALEDLAGDPTRRLLLARNAKRTFDEIFSADRVYGEMIAYLDSFARRRS